MKMNEAKKQLKEFFDDVDVASIERDGAGYITAYLFGSVPYSLTLVGNRLCISLQCPERVLPILKVKTLKVQNKDTLKIGAREKWTVKVVERIGEVSGGPASE